MKSCIPLMWLTALAAWSTAFAAEPTLHSFKKQQLDKHYWSEGAILGDLNKDGKPDAISGPFWWEGPAFTKRHEIYPATRTTKTKNQKGEEVEFAGFEGNFGSRNAYSTDNFFSFVYDFNGDGWNDVLTYGLPGTPAFLYLNPKGKEQHWERHQVFDAVDNESPTFVDITGDGKPEVVCNSGGNFGYASPDWKNVTAKWKFTPISEKGSAGRFTHGLGVGDINGDGKLDILYAGGWFEQPASLTGDPIWKQHKVQFAPAAAQIYAYDVNGDGRADVITALAAHGYGLAWHEQLAEKNENGSPKWRSHVFMHKAPEENRYGVHFPELHAVELFDVDGDGLKDIVTGNCYWAHGPAIAPGPGEEGVLYWFKLVRNPDKSVDWVPHQIDAASGVGRQIGVADLNGDGRQDFIIGNKMGTFVFTHEAKKVSSEEFAKAQPPVKFPAFTDQPLDKMNVIVHTTRPNGTPAVVQPPGKKDEKAAPAKKAKATAPVQLAAADVKANPPLSTKGVLPVGLDGKPLNTDFETGDLRDWTATGDAFKNQPILGDTVAARRPGMASGHVGKYWIGTYEKGLGDEATGTLTSKPFRLTQRWAAFLVAAGPYNSTRVEIVNTGNGNVLFSTPGGDPEKFKQSNNSTETLAPVVVDLEKHQNKEVFIRVVDEQAGGHWGHLNFDDFKLYEERPVFANELKISAKALAAVAPKAAPKGPPPGPQDEVKHNGLSPEESVKAMTLPPGFKVTLFAGEPDVKQPIAFCIDDRGRLWVIENYTYPIRKPGEKGDDRIVVFEDTDGDGKHDKRTVFIEGLNLASGIEWGFGGVFVGAAPWLMHIPVKETASGPQPAGEPKKLLEGFAWHDTHEMLNTFTWGPDGWLYGCHGVFTHSHVKVVGAPDSERQFINAGVWRYQPVKKRFEVFAEGTSNPWGIDFNEYGHCFIEACVIPHLFHMIQGGRYQRQAGQHYAPTIAEAKRVAANYFDQNFAPQQGQPENSYTFKDVKVQPINPFIYDDIKTIADHRHYLGATPHGGNARSDSAGGGHAHAGLMCYLGGSWPKEYHGKLFIGNIHGQRLNVDNPERKGSGYVGKHAPDFLNFNDRASQTLNQQIDQDGNVYVIDWYDRQQCHNQRDPNVHDRSNGRIYKISYGDKKATQVDLAKEDWKVLTKNLTHSNEWVARHSRRILEERASQKQIGNEPLQLLRDLLSLNQRDLRNLFYASLLSDKSLSEDVKHLRWLWALHGVGGTKGLTEIELGMLLRNQHVGVRSWTIQFLCEDHKPGDAALKEFARLAKEDPSPVVRLYLASACQRLTVAERAPIVEALLAHAEDADDHNLPLMYWYATEPIVAANPAQGALLLAKAKLPIVREYITRRLTAK